MRIPSMEKRISRCFSTFIINCLRDKNIGFKRIVDALQVEPETIEHIKEGEENFTVKQVIKIEEAFDIRFSSLLLEEMEGSKRREEYEDLIELVKKGERLQKAHVP